MPWKEFCVMEAASMAPLLFPGRQGHLEENAGSGIWPNRQMPSPARGLQMRIAPQDVVRVLNAVVAHVIT